ncbi:hypothetical protein PISMIDRAFT_17112 [Pisolithus microcarpus 441]|uniref:Uncharacterized protein n=1 Tax=Pisolithus microcarpus 441 TaxID=765257 RepID=A0A0C9XQZ2_9AGAM|nr:hypothetical protein PISMIDRAFT_17112 [Pisolithus microcarpus 441]
MSVWRLMTWMLTGSKQKSDAEVNRLVSCVITADDFWPEDLRHFNARTELKRFDASEEDLQSDHIFRKDGWMETSVSIEVPTRDRDPDGNGQTFTVSSFFYRKLTAVIETAFSDCASKFFHLTPFRRIWQSAVTGKEQQLYDELYTSDAWIKAHDEVQKQRRDDGCTLEWVIAGLMLSSDATHLTQFGHASAWPVYLFFGNQSKYMRIPQTIFDFISQFTKKKNRGDILAHCKRELVHAVWKILLDEDFVNAHKDGIVVKCYDGVCRRIFPRIFTYSADYPEKALLATIRDKGECPCPRCLLPKGNFSRLGLLSDLATRTANIRQYFCNRVIAARDAIYKLGAPIKGAALEQFLKGMLLVPTLNSFAEILGPLGWNIFAMFTVNLLHEFELGVFKSVFRHLLRLLYAINPEAINILNMRFREIRSFGKASIRRFPLDVSEMHQCAAWHFQNVLQCAIPAFEGLFPPDHDNVIRTLLFRLAQWHALAKLRLHMDDSLELLKHATRLLGQQLRKFQEFTCASFQTTELPFETAAWQRAREAKVDSTSASRSGMCWPKTFNLSTYKMHALGDYADTIRMFGTTDSYTTQIGELAHRQIKKFYQCTNKHNPMSQLAKQERRFTHVCRELDDIVDSDSEEKEENIPLTSRYHLSYRNAVNLATFLNDHNGDPAIKDFIPRLRAHLLARLQNFVNNLNCVFMPKRLQLNFMTYDICCDQDTLYSDRGDTIMMRSCEEGAGAHPFWYARLIRACIFHVYYEGARHYMDVLWVRWLGVEPGYCWGINQARLPKVGFVPDCESAGAFGFVDPALVIRACHLIPVFTEGRTDSLLCQGPSLVWPKDEVDNWTSYYVNIFADRDMFARFSHVGVGHEAQYSVSVQMNLEDISDDSNEGESSQVPGNEGPLGEREYEASRMDDVDPLSSSDDEDEDCINLESSLDGDGSGRESYSEEDTDVDPIF